MVVTELIEMKLLKGLGALLSGVAMVAWVLAPASAAAAVGTSRADAPAKTTGTAQVDTSDDSAWFDHIDELLAAGDYEEHEAIATITPDIEVRYSDAADYADIRYERIYETEGSAYETATGETLPEEALDGARDGSETVSADDVEVETYVVRAPGRTARELLELLADDPRVLDATPNYVYGSLEDWPEDAEDADDDALAAEFADAGSGSFAYATSEAGEDDPGTASAESAGVGFASVGTASPAPTKSGAFAPGAAQDVTNSLDATSLQWAFNRGTTANTFHGQRSLEATLSSYGWDGAKSASGIVAVFDTGIDYTHPDLAPVMADMTPYLAAAGGTSHGYNALDTSKEPLDDNGHGTHVAGIVAAASNGVGVTGAANGAKLLSVKAGDAGGHFTVEDITRGYDYLKKVVAAGADVRVVNNSWSGKFESDAIATAVLDLGKLGVVSVFASGNNAKDIEGGGYTACMFAYNPYSIVVNSLDMDGNASRFTNRGGTNTDVFAPGGSIFSTTRMGLPGTYVPSAMRSTSSTFVTFSGEGDSVLVQTDRGSGLGALDANAGFDDEGGCYSIGGKDLANAVTSGFGSAAAERVVMYVPVDESRLSQASMVGCAVNLTGRSSTEVWLEVLDSRGYSVGNTSERKLVDNGNWTTLSLDLNRVCTSRNRQVALYRDSTGKAYIKVAICIEKKVAASKAGLKIDCVGVGSTSWHYGFMSGTSMAAPVVSGLAAVMTSEIPGYTALPQAARAFKAAELVVESASKRTGLSGLCWSGGVVGPGAFAEAIASDSGPYLVSASFEDDPDGTSTLFTVEGMGFGTQQGSTLFTSLGELGVDYEVVSWTDIQIVLRLKSKIEGSEKVEVKVTNSEGKTSGALTTSVLGGDSGDSDDPDSPETPADPQDPANPPATDSKGGPQDAKTDSGGASSARAGKAAAAGLANTGDRTAALVIVLLTGGLVVLAVAFAVGRRRK